ncbi:MAG: MATE family efflux transporter [Clostridia bacterium]|nr:MATE family efflux transporter [Clostridia bacterium]
MLKERIVKLFNANRNIFMNVLAAFVVKGGSMVLSLFLLPAYIRFFGNQNVLGVWYTILSVLNWVLMFDLGIGNGMRNELPRAFSENDREGAQRLVSSTYLSTCAFVLVLGALGSVAIRLLDWNALLNLSESDLPANVLTMAVQIAFIGVMVQFVLKLVTSFLYAIQKSAMVNLLTLLSNVIILAALNLLGSGTSESNIIRMAWVNVLAVNTPLLVVSIVLFAGKYRQYRPRLGKFDMSVTKKVLQIGVTILWLQLVFMVISSTNEFLIARFCAPVDVIEYQVYFKIFNCVASVCSLALIPIWSAVTKAQAEKRFAWINGTYSVLLAATLAVLLVEIVIAFILQKLVNIWLKADAITVSVQYALIFSVSSWIFVVHNVNTSIGNGMSFFKPQMVFMTLAAVVDIPLAWVFVKVFGGWIGIVVANILALVPFEIAQPIFLKRHLRKLMAGSAEIPEAQ